MKILGIIFAILIAVYFVFSVVDLVVKIVKRKKEREQYIQVDEGQDLSKNQDEGGQIDG